MAKAKMNQLLEMFRGKIGGLVFRRMPDGSIVVSGAPFYHKRKGTPGQKAYRQTFRQRAREAKFLAREYPIYAELAADRPLITAYNVAVSDCSFPPVIHRILRKDGRILVQASDTVWVEKVVVSIRDGQGLLLESGNASRLGDDWWEYIPQADGVKITAQAWDLPGNHARLDLE